MVEESAAREEKAAVGLKERFLMTSRGEKPVLKLQVQSDVRPVWTALISDMVVEAPRTLSGRRLVNAAHQLREHVQGLVAAGGQMRCTR